MIKKNGGNSTVFNNAENLSMNFFFQEEIQYQK